MPFSLLAFALLAQPKPSLAGATREEKGGWIVLHLRGKPQDIGYQYGSLAATEIDDAHQAVRAQLKAETGKDWTYFRDTTKRLFWDSIPEEYKQEMQGQADALQAKGVKLDVWDVLAFNAEIEISGYYMPWEASQRTGRIVSRAKESCSAFVATGGTTRDGKLVMGHNLWWDYTTGQRFRTVLDISPQHGHRLKMDTLTGFIHSGSDFAINSAGMVLCETTISGFHGFDPKGVPEFIRMRRAIQYGDSIDSMSAIFRQGNNGGYANTWLMGDNKTNEIGKLELGLKNTPLTRTKDGYFVGANFPEDPKLIKEEVSWFDPDPKRNSCLRRKTRWNTLLTQNRAAVDAESGKAFLADTYDEVLDKHGASGSTLCGRGGGSGAVNSKVVTGDLVKQMSFWARMGFSDGYALTAADVLSKSPWMSNMKPYLKDMPTQPWVLVK